MDLVKFINEEVRCSINQHLSRLNNTGYPRGLFGVAQV